jgi:hypothetical protein
VVHFHQVAARFSAACRASEAAHADTDEAFAWDNLE